MLYEETKENLAEYYTDIGDYKRDFRDLNLFRLVSRHVRGNQVLDIGAGSGGFLHFLSGINSATLYGLEPNEKLVEAAREKNPRSVIERGFCEEISQIFGLKFDTIVMLDVLEHTENDSEVLRKIYGQLNSDGLFILVVPSHKFLFGGRDKRYGHYRRYSKKELVRTVEDAGFKIEKIRHWNALGVMPYWFSEKVMKRPLETSIRSEKKNILEKTANSLLGWWFRLVENNLSLGFGLSLVCLANKNV